MVAQRNHLLLLLICLAFSYTGFVLVLATSGSGTLPIRVVNCRPNEDNNLDIQAYKTGLELFLSCATRAENKPLKSCVWIQETTVCPGKSVYVGVESGNGNCTLSVNNVKAETNQNGITIPWHWQCILVEEGNQVPFVGEFRIYHQESEGKTVE